MQSMVFLAIFAINSSKLSLASFGWACGIRTATVLPGEVWMIAPIGVICVTILWIPTKLACLGASLFIGLPTCHVSLEWGLWHQLQVVIIFIPSGTSWSCLVRLATYSVKALMASLSRFGASLLKILLDPLRSILLIAICSRRSNAASSVLFISEPPVAVITRFFMTGLSPR